VVLPFPNPLFLGIVMRFTLSTWNVNGARKLKRYFQNPSRAFVHSDVILLQETWVADNSEQLIIHDYVSFHEAAIPAIGRNVMGLLSFFRLTSFSGGTLQKLASPLPWVLAVRWAVGDNGVIFVMPPFTRLGVCGRTLRSSATTSAT
jgi:hypothetical protein